MLFFGHVANVMISAEIANIGVQSHSMSLESCQIVRRVSL